MNLTMKNSTTASLVTLVSIFAAALIGMALSRVLPEDHVGSSSPIEKRSGYFFVSTGGPLTRLPTRSTSTSTRSAILMRGMPLFIP